MIQQTKFLQLMADLGVTKAELARRLGVNRSAITTVLRLNKSIDMPVLQRMAKALGYEVEISFKPIAKN